MKRVGIIGSKHWQSKRKVQQTLGELKTRIGDDVVIVGAGGVEGANHMVRKYAIEFAMQYTEFNPSYSGYNLYSAMPESYYGKSYHFSQLHHRMKLLAEHCEYLVILSNESQLDPILKTAYTTASKREKPVVILN